LQSISVFIEAAWCKTLREVNRDSGAQSLPNNSVENYMSTKADWHLDFID